MVGPVEVLGGGSYRMRVFPAHAFLRTRAGGWTSIFAQLDPEQAPDGRHAHEARRAQHQRAAAPLSADVQELHKAVWEIKQRLVLEAANRDAARAFPRRATRCSEAGMIIEAA